MISDDTLRATMARWTADDRLFPPTPAEVLPLRPARPPAGRHRAARRRRTQTWNPIWRFLLQLAIIVWGTAVVVLGAVWVAQYALDSGEPRPATWIPAPHPGPRPFGG